MERIRQSGQRVEKPRQNADRPPYRRAGFPDKPSAGRGDAPSGVSSRSNPRGAASNSWWTTPTIGRTSKRRSSTSPKTICARTLRTRRSLSRAACTGTPYTAEYDTPGGEPIGSVISAYEFDASPQDVALLRNISRVSAAAHMPFIGAIGPAFFL